MIDMIKRLAVKNEITYEIIYICYIFCEKILSLMYLIMSIRPIDNKKIVFCTVKGKRYGDNPMYISDEFLKRSKRYKIVWLIDKNINEELPKGVIRKNYTLLNVVKELTTAKVWVDSNMKYSGFLKRKNQLYVQTWHGSYGLKKIAGDLGNKLPKIDRRNHKYNAEMTDIMVSNSKRTTEIYRNAFWYKGKVLEYGSPRNDVFFGNTEKLKQKVFKHFGLQDVHIVLYAPTFRNNYRTDDFKLDYVRLQKVLKNKFGGEWVVFIRLHPNNLADAADLIEYTDTIINASEYSIMQELLVASDILITDYSSCMFDFATTKKPCFLYATDVVKYKEERDYYFELEELPFPLAQNNDEMEQVIMGFEQDIYEQELEKLFKQVGLNETGHASEKVADYIEEWMANN